MAAKSNGIAGAASATFGLSISEKWIRERLNLHKESLGKAEERRRIASYIFTLQFLFFSDDVRSLSLPGSYCEKITHLGRSLMGFTRLKHLDLSRNAIESLDVSPSPSRLLISLSPAQSLA